MHRLFNYKNAFRILKGGKISLVVSALLTTSTLVHASPSGGDVTSGNANISQSGNTTNINQSTQKATINWQKFDISKNETVNFNQPNKESVTLNRVVGANNSVIQGSMNANGQVILVNPNGVVFSEGSQVNVGGIVATTKNIKDEDFQNGNYKFEGDSSASIINKGNIKAKYVAMMGKEVINEGRIEATLGRVELAGGNKFSLNINGDSLLKLTIEEGTLNALVKNKGIIKADGGKVYLTTQALDSILDGMVNNTGIIEAQSLSTNEKGEVVLFAHGGTADIGGEIKAEGGFVETSGKDFKIQPKATIKAKEWLIDPVNITIDSTLASSVETALGSGDVIIETTAYSTPSTSSVDTTTAESAGAGNIIVDSAINWSSANKLTLHADNSIYINNVITASSGSLALEYGQSSTAGVGSGVYFGFDTSGGFAGKVNLSYGLGKLSMKKGSTGTLDNYWVLINNSATYFPEWNSSLNFALGADITVNTGRFSSFSGKFNGLGHTISGVTLNSSGSDNIGLFGNNTGAISNLILDNVTIVGNNNVGAIAGSSSGAIDSVAVKNSSITGYGSNIGGIVGYMAGNLTNSYAKSNTINAGSISQENLGHDFGGLVGFRPDPRNNSIGNSFYDLSTTTFNVYNTSLLGAGSEDQSNQVTTGGIYDGASHDGQFSDWINGKRSLNVANYFSTTLVDGNTYYEVANTTDLKDMLGFAGASTMGAGSYGFALTANIDLSSIDGWHIPYLGTILTGKNGSGNYTLSNLNNSQAYNTFQGLAGYLGFGGVNNLNISGTVKGYQAVGGIAGSVYQSTINNIISSLNVNGQLNNVGGLSGELSSASHISNSTVNGNVVGNDSVGGVVGSVLPHSGDSVTYTIMNGTTTGHDVVGGIAGYIGATDTISHNQATGAVSGRNIVGGLVGANAGVVTYNTASGNVTGTGERIGGLLGSNDGWGGYVTNSTSSGTVLGSWNVGGLVGFNSSSIADSSSSSDVSATNENAGGLVGYSLYTAGGSGSILRSYATGSATGLYNVGGLVGRNNDGMTITDSYSTANVTGSSSTSTQLGGLVGSWGEPTNISNSYYYLKNGNNGVTITKNGVDISDKVTLGALTEAQYNAWQTQATPRTALTASTYFGTADSNGVYTIDSTADLWNMLAFAGNSSLSFKLANNIDMNNVSFTLPYLAASLNGNNHIITNINDSQSWNDFQGFVGYLSGSISNLGLYGVISGYNNVGGIAGYLKGTITNSYSDIDVTSVATATSNYQSGYQGVGGVVGQVSATGNISDAYSSGNIEGANNNSVGGVVGVVSAGGTVTRTYANGTINCTNGCTAGGVVGIGSTTASFWNPTSTGVSTSPSGTSTTNEEMMNIATYNGSANWSISNVGGSNATWRIYDGQTAPLLRSFLEAFTVTANNGTRVYDGTTVSSFGVTYSQTPDSNILGTAVVTASSKNAGTRTLVASGKYSNQLGYDISFVDGEMVIEKKVLTIDGTTAQDKVYDGTTDVTVNLGTLDGFVGSETVSTTAIGTFNSKDVGNRTATFVYTLEDGTNGGLADNYILANTTDDATISKKLLTIGGADSWLFANDKTYDGNANTTVDILFGSGMASLNGLVGSETIHVTADGEFGNANAGNNKDVDVSFNLANGTNGGLASNYEIANITKQANILKKYITVAGNFTANNKVYDGNTNATFATNNIVLDGVVNGEELILSNLGLEFLNKNAGNGKTVRLIGGAIASTQNGNANNYVFTLGEVPPTTTANITKKVLTIDGTTAQDKIYDGNTNATVNLGTLNGLIGNETLNNSVVGTFNSKDAGNRTVNFVYTLSDGTNGGLSNNYILANTSDDAIISKKTLTINGTTAQDKIYDGTTTATVNLGVLNGLIGNETLNNSLVGTFNLKDAGNRTVNFVYTLSDGTNGGLSSNYILANTTDEAVINKANVNYSVEGQTLTSGEKYLLPTPNLVGGTPSGKATVKVYDEQNIDVTEQALSGTLKAGKYIVKTVDLEDINYQLATSGNTDGILTINQNVDINSIVTNIVNNAIKNNIPVSTLIQPKIEAQNGFEKRVNSTIVNNTPNVGNDKSLGRVNLGLNEVIRTVKPSVNEVAKDTKLTVVGETAGEGKIATVELADLVAKSGGGELRVALSPDSFVELVNGGVTLPEGVSQEFYVVEDKK